MSDVNVVLVYHDKGPCGISAQSLSITRSWTKLYLCDTVDQAKGLAEKCDTSGRKNPRWIITTTDEHDGFDELVDMRKKSNLSKPEPPPNRDTTEGKVPSYKSRMKD